MRITIRQAVATGLLAMTPALTGCLVHTRSVLKTRLPDIVRNATLDQLLKQVDERNAAIQSMTLYVRMSTSTGGSLQGEVKESISFNGFIIVGKPEQINVILTLPIVGSQALNMVSDGKTFKMLIPPKNCAIVGSDVVTNSSQKGLYSLRPAVILDSLLIHGLEPDQIVTMTQDSRVIENPKKRKDLIQDPDYDIEFLSQPQGQTARTLHVVHIDRMNLLPWRQDIYNAEGKIETQAFYSNYQKFGDITFPTKIVIQRPLDELGLTITITKGTTFNQPLLEDQFKLDIPDTTAHLTNMDDPASATIKDPCAAHVPQSQH
ncbi:MAG: outer membrane lipoprotein-sorting protein [Acidobacteriaceae bacterium]